MKNRKRLFWILQASGWLCYFTVILLTYWAWGTLTAAVLRELGTAVAACFVVSLALRLFYRKMKARDCSVYALSLRAFLLTLLGGNIIVGIITVLEHLFFRAPQAASLTFNHYLAAVVSWTAPLIGWSALYFGIRFWQEWMVQKEKAEKADALARTAQLQMLRYRMNPHFLFNTLNSIRALISEDKTSAKNMVTELSDYLRYSLVSRNFANVPFKDELESVRHYFNIQKMRYENKLDVSFDIEPASEEFPITSYLLHPLVENAVKYGMGTSSLPLRIQISAKIHQGALRIEVVNSGSWLEPRAQERDGVIGGGLENVRRRLADAYPGRHHFEISEKEGFVRVRLAIEREARR